MLNALFLDPSVSGGPETYLRELAPALLRQAPGLKLTVVTTGSGASALRADGWDDWATLQALPCEDGQRLRRTFAEQALLPRLARRSRVDVLHSLASVAPVRAGVPDTITLHDVTFLVRRTFDRVTTFGLGQIVARAARRANSLIAVSAAARDEICRVLGLERARFTVVPHGAGRVLGVEPASATELRARHRLGNKRVILCVAAKRPHKNQELLLRAMNLMPEDALLVLAGHAEPYEDDLRQLADELSVSERVRLLGYLPDRELEGLWRLAACAAFPTLAEGFGLPVIEAMARGVPVACSDLPVLREVGGDLPHYFPSGDARAAAAAIQAAWADQDARAAGPERAAQFSWDSAAAGTLEAYDRALAAAAR